LIGDAAYTMTPAAGAGIKYAIEDAVVAANVLAAPLLAGRVGQRDLAEVQRRRIWPTRFIQAFGAFGLRQIGRVLKSRRPPALPWIAKLALRTPLLSLFARLVAIGLWRVKVEE
jgi:2-polyprenyl-6-methoxyphenol hydroxylase-like FAD-dependent oxidoreductase